MNIYEHEVGLPVGELDTPVLLLDIAAVERNIQKMADFARKAGVGLRPHAKIYKGTPVFAWMQLNAGAIGLTASKVSEAEVLASGGIRDILIANQVVGQRKIQRLVNLASYTDIIVAVDSFDNVQQLSAAAEARRVTVGVLIEVNIGNNRCGVEPFGPWHWRRPCCRRAGLRGVMGYDGQLVFVKDFADRDRRSEQGYRLLVETRRFIENAGLPVEIASGGGTVTYRSASSVPGVTELQVGTYLFMDTTYSKLGLSDYECALSVLATVISRPDRPGAEDLAILDVGRKAMDLTYGFPEVKRPAGEIVSMPQEHSRLKLQAPGPEPRIGDKVELWVSDVNGTFNLHDKVYIIRNGLVEAVWEISGRGKVT
jgi:D-serine deaminase-like pyridoxal phosphate-dependent protein